VSGAIDRFTEAARVAGVPVEVHRFAEGTKTAQDAARAVGCDVAQIVKSLIFVDEHDAPILALTSGKHRVDTAKLASVAGVASVRRATPEQARSATGFAVGGTPPFGHPEPIRSSSTPSSCVTTCSGPQRAPPTPSSRSSRANCAASRTGA
jgi:prolyl-tRNA editing enzyme YbaK/EbsC (Cys-tRNA(Pro) deacylase)